MTSAALPQYTPYNGYRLPPLIRGTLLKRYKRFLADVKLEDGRTVTAHCPNSGSMRACCEPDRPVYLSTSDNPKRKLKYTWELIEMPGSLVGVNTQVPNKLVRDSIVSGRVSELTGYDRYTPEVKTSDHTRLDILVEGPAVPPCYVEVKNCTLVAGGTARFPDAVTTRGQKHLTELADLAKRGNRAVIFFLIQRMDARRFIPAADIDPVYAESLARVTQSGVEVIARQANMGLDRIVMGPALPVMLP